MSEPSWKNLGGTRHAFIAGETLCGAAALERNGEAPPCQICLATLMTLVDAAFYEI